MTTQIPAGPRDLTEARARARPYENSGWVALDVSAGWLMAHDFAVNEPPPCDLCGGEACGPDLTPALSVYFVENASEKDVVGEWIARLCFRCVSKFRNDGIDLRDAIRAFYDAGREENVALDGRRDGRVTNAHMYLAEIKLTAGRQLVGKLMIPVLRALGVDSVSIRRGLLDWTHSQRWVDELLPSTDSESSRL